VLRTLPDKQVRIESHPYDPPPATQQSRDRVPTNWELSMTRTARIVQHLLDDGAVDAGNLSIGISPDARLPMGTGAEDGATGRRMGIILSPKN
jgi:hypothetical protein